MKKILILLTISIFISSCSKKENKDNNDLTPTSNNSESISEENVVIEKKIQSDEIVWATNIEVKQNEYSPYVVLKWNADISRNYLNKRFYWQVWYRELNSQDEYIKLPGAKVIDPKAENKVFTREIINNIKKSTEYEIIIKAKVDKKIFAGKRIEIKTLHHPLSTITLGDIKTFPDSAFIELPLGIRKGDVLELYLDDKLHGLFDSSYKLIEIYGLESGKSYSFAAYRRQLSDGNKSKKIPINFRTPNKYKLNKDSFSHYQESIKDQYNEVDTVDYHNYFYIPYSKQPEMYLVDAIKEKKLEVLKSYIEEGGDVNLNFSGERAGWISLLYACAYLGFYEGVEYLYTFKPEDYLDSRILYAAICSGNLDLVNFIYNYDGFDKEDLSDLKLTYINTDRQFAYVTAIKNSYLDILDFIMGNIPRDINYILYTAVRLGNIEIVNYLIEKGADPDSFLSIKDNNYLRRIICGAVYDQQYEIIELLLSKGYRGSIPNYNHISMKEFQTLDLSNKYGFEYFSDNLYIFNKGIYKEDFFSIITVLKYTDYISDDELYNLIDYGLKYKFFDFLDNFELSGIYLKDLNILLPKLIAKYCRDEEVMNYLSQKKINLDSLNHQGRNALFYASNKDSLIVLLDLGIDKTIVDNEGYNLTDWYKKKYKEDFIEFIVK